MKSQYNEHEAAAFEGDAVEMRVYTSRLLGRDPSLVLHGGGNTSVKAGATNIFGDEEQLLYIKGSGGDLATIDRAGFAPVRLDVLLKMAALEQLADSDMVRIQRSAMTDPYAPNPSVEAILHAIIPFRYVDHTHADAVVAITNTPGGDERIREIFGARVLVIPYVMPGFILARAVYEATRHTDWTRLDGMILLHHGVFTFADDARESYERMVRLVDKAENHLERQGALGGSVPAAPESVTSGPTGNMPHAEPALTGPLALRHLATLRRAVSDLRQAPVIASLDAGESAAGYSRLPNLYAVALQGPLTPDHVIRTKRVPVIVGDGSLADGFGAPLEPPDARPLDSRPLDLRYPASTDQSTVPTIGEQLPAQTIPQQLSTSAVPEPSSGTGEPSPASATRSSSSGAGELSPDQAVVAAGAQTLITDDAIREAVSRYGDDYRAYFERHNPGGLTMLDPAPRWAVWRGMGTVSFGRSAPEAGIVADIVAHTTVAQRWAEALGGWRALPERDLFEMEYWELEQAKLKGGATALALQGRIALVTGAASGIGRAAASLLRAQGASVVALDRNASVVDQFTGSGALGVECDVTDAGQVRRAVERTVAQFGGLDIVVSNAGSFPASVAIADMPPDTWDHSLALNLTSHQMLLTAAIPYLELGWEPAVVIVGSKNVHAPGPGVAAYSVAKAGLTQLARVAALELAPKGIRVNTVHPNAVFDTGIWSDEVLKRRADNYGLTVEQYKTNNLLGVEVTSRDVAALICALAGPLFSRTTGAQVPVDGGNDRVV